MFQDIVRLTVQRIFNDKILLGLLIVCLLGFFVGGFNNNKNEPPINKVRENEAVPQKSISEQAPVPVNPQTTNFATKVQLDPTLAVDFVKWWMKASMDYAPKSAAQSHEAASNWMAPEALKAFNEAFWTPEMAQEVCSGATVGAFQPVSIRAVAINPDHSIVVTLTGTLVLQAANARPIANQVQMNLLVRKGNTGLRIVGISNQVTSPNTSVY